MAAEKLFTPLKLLGEIGLHIRFIYLNALKTDFSWRILKLIFDVPI